MGMSDWLPRPHEPLPGYPRVRLRYLSDEADLRQNETLMDLFAEAAGEGDVSNDDAGLLRFFAAAEHSLYVQGVVDRPAMFRRIVRGKWSLITSEAEARGRQRLEAIQWDRQFPGGSPDVSA